MTKKQLIDALKGVPNDAPVLLMTDWDNCEINEQGCYCGEYLKDMDAECNVMVQTVVIDSGLDFYEEKQVIIG